MTVEESGLQTVSLYNSCISFKRIGTDLFRSVSLLFITFSAYFIPPSSFYGTNYFYIGYRYFYIYVARKMIQLF